MEREVHTLKKVKEARASSESRAVSLEHRSQDLQSKLQQAEAERDVQQAELLEARKELQKLVVNLEQECRVNTSLCDQTTLLKADLSVRSNQSLLSLRVCK